MSNSKDAGVSLKDLMAKIAQLEADLAAKNQRKATLKVSEKGALSFYGLRRMPITLYLQEMETILGMEQEIKAFIKANDSKLSKGRVKE